jgi:hypothetical protein
MDGMASAPPSMSGRSWLLSIGQSVESFFYKSTEEGFSVTDDP